MPQGNGSHPGFPFLGYTSPKSYQTLHLGELCPVKDMPGSPDLSGHSLTSAPIHASPSLQEALVLWLCCLVSHSESQATSLSALIFTLREAAGPPVSRKKLSYLGRHPECCSLSPHATPQGPKPGWLANVPPKNPRGLHACPTSALERQAAPHPSPARCNPVYQGPLEGKHSCRPGLLQWLHAAAPAPAAEGICLAVLQVEFPAKERGVLPALALSLCLPVLWERGGSYEGETGQDSKG